MRHRRMSGANSSNSDEDTALLNGNDHEREFELEPVARWNSSAKSALKSPNRKRALRVTWVDQSTVGSPIAQVSLSSAHVTASSFFFFHFPFHCCHTSIASAMRL
jgi:hypothetical protein